MERLFHMRDRWRNGLPLWVITVCAFSLPVLGIYLKRLRLENDVTTWLPEDDPDSVVLKWFGEEFEKEDRLLVSWDSSSIHDPRVEKFVSALGPDGRFPPTISGVTTPRDALRIMQENRVEPDEAVRRLTGILIGNGFLKVRLTDRLPIGQDEAVEQVRAVAQNYLKKEVRVLPAVLHREPLPPAEQPRSDTSESVADETFQYAIAPHDFQLRWEGISATGQEAANLISHLKRGDSGIANVLEDAFFSPGAPVALSVAISAYGEEAHAETMQTIRAAALSVGVAEPEFRIGGTTVARDRLSEASNEAVWNRDYPIWKFYKRSPILLSAIVGVLTSFIMLRSPLLAMQVLLGAGYACMLVMALIPATGKPLNIVLIVLPNLLMVLTMSGAIHVANYWKHAVADGKARPVAAAIGQAWIPCVLASVTTAIGMASLMTAVLAPVREFGIYASVGTLISLAVILLVFPSLLTLRPPGKGQTFTHAQVDSLRWKRFGGWLVRHRLLVNAACLVLFVFSVYGLRWFQTETRVIRYFLPHTRIVRDYNFLEESLAGIVSIETVVEFDDASRKNMNVLERMELIRRVERKIDEHPWISGTLSLADFRPVSEERPPDDAPTREKIRYGRAAQRTQKEVFETPKGDVSHFAKLAQRPLLAETDRGVQNTPVGAELWRVRAQADVLGEVDYGILTDDLNRIVSAELSGVAGTRFLVTGMVPLFLKTQRAVLQSLIDSFGLAFAVIAVVMIILLRHPVSGLIAMLPNLFPVGVVFGLVSWSNIPVDIGTMITASVALGIAIDGTLHLLKWFQEGIRQGLSKSEAVEQALGHCGPAMWQTSIAISLAMLMLAGADLLLIHRFGWLMASLIFVALLGDVVLLPCLLTGWLGSLIAANTRRSSVADESQGMSEPVSIEIASARTA